MTDHHRPPDNLVLEAMDQARIGYARTDRDGVILFMSEAFAYQGETELVDRDQAFKIPWFQLDHASDARKDMRAQVWKHFISHDAPWSGIIQWHLQDGGIRFFQGTATHVGDGTAILVINDRTSKILADKKVEETIDLYRQVLKDLPVAVAVTDLEGKVTYINEFLPNRFDRPTEEFYGKTITESFGNGLTELAEKVSAQHIANNRDIEGVVLNLTQRDGGVGTWLVNARPLFDAKGNRMATLNVAIDRTESRRLREEHTRLTEAMFEAQKISTLNDFAGNLAHELSNLLHPVAFYARRLAEEPDTEHRADYAAKVNRGVMTAGQILRRTLSLASRDSEGIAPCDINAILVETLTSARDLAPTGLHYETHLPGSPIMAEVEKAAFRQVLLNLFNNAAEAMHYVGTVTVSLDIVRQNIPAGLSVEDGSSVILLRISDEGPGIEPEIMDSLFDPFVTTKTAGRGTGLGLSVVRGLVTAWGGTVTVESAPDTGAAFCVWIPAPGVR